MALVKCVLRGQQGVIRIIYSPCWCMHSSMDCISATSGNAYRSVLNHL